MIYDTLYIYIHMQNPVSPTHILIDYLASTTNHAKSFKFVTINPHNRLIQWKIIFLLSIFLSSSFLSFLIKGN